MSLRFLSSYPNRPTRDNITVFIPKQTNKTQHYCLHTQTDQQETTLPSSYPNRPTRDNITVFIPKQTNKRQHYCLHTQTDQQETTLLSSYPNRPTRDKITVFIPKQTNKRQHYCLHTSEEDTEFVVSCVVSIDKKREAQHCMQLNSESCVQVTSKFMEH